MKKVDHTGLRTWIEIDTNALKHNYAVFRKLIPKTTKLCAVAKSNAYGHGLVDYAKFQEKQGVDFIAVDSIVEAITLREQGIKLPLLVLGYTLPENYIQAIKHDIRIAISSIQQIESLVTMKGIEGIKVHIKIDSGMHRQGFMEYDRESLFTLLEQYKKIITVDGLFTHFASPEAQDETKAQIFIFDSWIKDFKKHGLTPIVHAGATRGTLLHPEAHYDMVRIGIGLLGQGNYAVHLKQALSWKSIISEIKTVSMGDKIGYDFTAELRRDSRIAIVPVGYWHGFPRALSNIGSVFVGGHEAHVLGRVSMDMLIIDVTDTEAEVGSEVTLLGSESPLIDPEYVASLAETSAYELLTRLNPLIKKFYI